MKQNTYLTKQCLMEQIIQKKASTEDLIKIKHDFMNHLNKINGTIENYPNKILITKIMDHYPNIIDPSYGEEYTASKINSVMVNIAQYVQDNVRINNNPLIIKMILNHMRGKEDGNNFGLQQQIVINTRPPLLESGEFTLPEPKIAIVED